MSPRACDDCGSSLAPDQRYCLRCGQRLGEPFEQVAGAFALAPAALAAPGRRIALPRGRPGLVFGAAALGTAVLTGAALGPVVTGGATGSGRPGEVVLATPAAAPAASVFNQTPAAALSASALEAPSGNVASGGAGNSAADSGGGGDSGSAAPAASSAASPGPLPTDSSPTIPAPPASDTTPTTPSQPDDTAVAGTVVHVDDVDHRYVLTTDQGLLIPVHATKQPAVAKVVHVKVKKLANGTFAQTSTPSVGADKRDVTLGGNVTYADPATHTYTVSVRGASLFVHGVQDAAPPSLGAMATVHATLKDVTDSDGKPGTEIDQQTVDSTGQATGSVDHEGALQAVDLTAETITLGADDVRESARDIVVKVPPAIDVSKLKAGDLLDATLTIAPDGSYALTGYSHDETQKAADDLSTAQGDQRINP